MPTKQMHKYGLSYAHHVGPELEEKFGLQITALLDEILTPVLDKLKQRVHDIKASAKLSPLGQQEEIVKAGREAQAEIEKETAIQLRSFEKKLAALDLPSRVPTLTELAKQQKTDPTLLYMQAKELRDYLKSVDPVSQRPLLLDAAERGDVLLLAAATDVHPLLRPVNPAKSGGQDPLAEATEVWLRKQWPADAEVVTSALELHKANVAAARKVVAKETDVLGKEDVVAKAAKMQGATAA